MPKTREQKEEILERLRECFRRATSVVVARYGAMTVAQSQELRRMIKAEGGEYVVVRKSLLDVVSKERPELNLQPRSWAGSIGLLFGYVEETAPAKVLATFRKKNEIIDATGGIFEQQWIDAAKVELLSALPSKQQLYHQLVGLLNAQVSGFVNTLNANLRQLVSAIDAIGKAKA